jgi:predicted nucleic acid-binding protein
LQARPHDFEPEQPASASTREHAAEPTVETERGYLADTSVFVAYEQERTLGDPPAGDARISVATLTELGVGARRASDEALRDVREATLERARRFIALPYDEAVADRLAELLSAARDQQRRAGAMDAIIAATALVHGLAVWTQDEDFDVLAELAPGLIVRRDQTPGT